MKVVMALNSMLFLVPHASRLARVASARVTATLTDRHRGARWFTGSTMKPDFAHPASIGDYTGIAVNDNGAVLASWTDLRLQTCFATRCGSGQDVFFGTI